MKDFSKASYPGFNWDSFIPSIVAGIIATVVITLTLYVIHRLTEGWIYVAAPLFVLYIIIFLIHENHQNRKFQAIFKQKEQSIAEGERAFKQTLAQLPVDKVYTTQQAALDDILSSLSESNRKIKILVSRGTSLFGSKPTPTRFREKLAEKNVEETIKILMISPFSKYVEERRKETGLPGKQHTWESLEQYQKLIKESIEFTAELCSDPLKLSIGLYDHKIIWRFFILDDVLFLGSYTPRHIAVNGGERAYILKIYKNSNEASKQLFLAFERMFDSWWAEFEASEELRMELQRICASLSVK